jgi:TldD protein
LDASLRALATRALDAAAAAGARYADARVVRRRWETVSLRNGAPSREVGEDEGLGVRALAGDAWGFAASHLLEGPEADRVGLLAHRTAEASARCGWSVAFEPPPPAVFSAGGPCGVDPFTVPLARKLELLTACDAAMRAVPGVGAAFSALDFLREERLLVSTAGSELHQVLTDSGGGLRAVARDEGGVQQRSHPHLFGWHAERGGWEVVEEMALTAHAARVAEEAAALLTAPPCPAGTTTVVLDASQAAIQLHETIGHALELDRVFGMEAATAGTSFLEPDGLGAFRVGSEAVSVTVDPTLPRGIGSFFFDDDGTPARRVELVRDGVHVDYLSGRDTAAAIGRPSSGCSRAESWNRVPLVRMTNVNLTPGDRSLEDLLAETDRGIWLETTRSWSVDERRLQFQFATEVAREIRGGRLGRLYRGGVYRGRTPDFWGRCDAVADAASWRLLSVNRCFKGQPGQLVRVSHGAAPARFREVTVAG